MQAQVAHTRPQPPPQLVFCPHCPGGAGGPVHHKARMRPNIHLEMTAFDNNLLDSNARFLYTPFW